MPTNQNISVFWTLHFHEIFWASDATQYANDRVSKSSPIHNSKQQHMISDASQSSKMQAWCGKQHQNWYDA